MSVTSIEKDFDTLTFTVIADFDAPVERVWQLYADPRQMERWWGPPSYPATVEEHDLTPGGRVRYYMTGPDGEKYRGLWEVVEVEPPHAFMVRDFFADDEGNPVPGMPEAAVHVQLSERAGGTRVEMRSVYPTKEQLEQIIEMGAEEGVRQSLAQIDDLLAA